MASRILGLGDVLYLIEKVQNTMDQDNAREMEQKIRKAEFDFNDFLEQFAQVKKMGSLADIMGMIPGMGKLPEGVEMPDDKSVGRIEAIIKSMTMEERTHPEILNVSRKRRIAAGAGVDISEVNRLVKQFDQSRKMMKQMSGMMKGKRKGGLGGLFGGKGGGFGLPF